MQTFLRRTPGIAARIGLIGIVGLAMAGLISILVLPLAVFATEAVERVETDVFDIPPLPDADRLIENSFIYAADGSELAEISFNESRNVVTLDEIPDDLINAVVATEDADFWEHNGVNLESIVRAAASNVIAGEIESGASTITQQYVKNTYIDVERRTEQSYDRKLQEALWAVQIEELKTKDEILEDYLNRIALGDGVYGVEKAAERYFSTSLEDLTLGQAATIAGMIRSPEGNNPITNPRNALTRRNIVLTQMAAQGYISDEQARIWSQRPLGVRPTEPEAFDDPYWVDFVTRQLYKQEAAQAMGLPEDLLDALGATEDERIQTVFQTGLRIHTTLDPTSQDVAEESILEALTYEGETRQEIAREPFGGIVSVVPGDGAITTMALGPFEYGSCDDPIGYDDAGRVLCDRTKFNPLIPADAGSTRSGRQPGSSFKPLLITAALESGFPPGWTADSTSGQLIDGPAGCSDQEPWEPENSGSTEQFLDMYTGVKASSNVYHAQLVSEVGPAKLVDTANRAGIFASSLDPVCSMALGTEEVFPLEMASAYATLAARGEFCQPYAISRIETRDGRLLYEHSPDCVQAVDESVVDRVVDIMEGPVTSGGTAPFIAGDLSPHPARGKTGTTQDYRDAWFVGFVPQLATAAWVGYPNGVTTYDCELNPDKCEVEDNLCYDVNEGANTRSCIETRFLSNQTIGGDYYSRVFGGTIPAPMWSDYMQVVTADMEPLSFTDPGPIPGALVPNLARIGSVEEMRAIVEEANLRFFVDEIPFWLPAGTYVGQSPAPGTTIPAGRAVVVQVSDGSLPKPRIPNFVGMPSSEVRGLATSNGLSVVFRDRDVNRPRLDGIVVGQSPGAGASYDPRTSTRVVVFVGRYVEPEEEGGGGRGGGGGGGGGGGDEPSPPPEPSTPPGGGRGGGGGGGGGDDTDPADG